VVALFRSAKARLGLIVVGRYPVAMITSLLLSVLLAAPAQEVPAPDPDPLAKAPTVSAAQITKAQKRAVQILLALQESMDDDSGEAVLDEWPYEGVYRVRGEIPSGYRVGGTSIVAEALLESSEARKQREVRKAVERALDFVLEMLETRDMQSGFKGTYDVRGWGHTYALSFMLTMRRLEAVPKGKEDVVDLTVRWLVETLTATEIIENGGWNYSRRAGAKKPNAPSPFMTAPTLMTLFEAKRQGESVSDDVINRGLGALESARHGESGAFVYAGSAGRRAEDVPGAIGRMPVSELTLHLAGRGSLDRIRASIDAFFEHWEWLEIRRRQNGTHIPPYGIAPYYFFYAHRYVAAAIEALPEAERADYRAKLYSLLWMIREDSGGWNDRVFPRSENFGTAMTLFALQAPGAPAPAGWAPTLAEPPVK